MSALFEHILAALPPHWRSDSLYLGVNWTLAVVQNQAGQRRAGLAATPGSEWLAVQTRYHYGFNPVEPTAAAHLAQSVHSANPVEAAVGLATLNALLPLQSERLTAVDAADWLLVHGQGRNVALVGHFPFVEELKPIVAQLWVLELSPQPGDYSADAAPQLIPQADVVAITSSTLINHTLEGLLVLTRPEAKVMLLGPSTPLTPLLFEWGLDLLSGVQVVDIEATLASVAESVNFQKMKGVRRVTLERRA